jgi:excisionase family DNA binding protein
MKDPETIGGVRALLGDDALVTEREAAEILCVHVDTLARMRRSKEIPYGRIGKKIVYSVGVIRRVARMATAA